MKEQIDYRVLGLRVKDVRIKKGLTQEMLAELVGCNTSHISNIENNHTKVSLNVLHTIARVLDTTVDYLLYSQFVKDSAELSSELIKLFTELSPAMKEALISVATTLKAVDNNKII